MNLTQSGFCGNRAIIVPVVIALVSGGLLLAYLQTLGPDLARAARRREAAA